MASGPIISTIGSGTLSLQNAKSASAKVDSQKVQSPETKAPARGDTVSTEAVSSKAATLSGILDGISQSIQAIETTQKSAEKIFSLLKHGLNLAHQASQNIVPPNVSELSSLKVKFNNILRQISQAADGAGYRGTNLLKGDDLPTSFGENARNNILTQSIDASAEGLGIAETNFSSVESIDLANEQIGDAIKVLENFESSLREDLGLIKTRQDFTKETIGSIDDTAQSVDTDEGANLLALQIGQQLAQLGDKSLASTDQKDLLRLF